jgi:hypothetical protein
VRYDSWSDAFYPCIDFNSGWALFVYISDSGI